MPARVVKYQLVETSGPQPLSDRVNQLIQEGWQPFGQPVVVVLPAGDNYDIEWAYCQAMVITEEETIKNA